MALLKVRYCVRHFEGVFTFPVVSSRFPILYAFRMLSARAARENFKEIDVLASQIPKIFSETYLPTYLPAGGRQPPTYLPTSRPMPDQSYVGRESTKRRSVSKLISNPLP